MKWIDIKMRIFKSIFNFSFLNRVPIYSGKAPIKKKKDSIEIPPVTPISRKSRCSACTPFLIKKIDVR